jgi:hypothetical protein
MDLAEFPWRFCQPSAKRHGGAAFAGWMRQRVCKMNPEMETGRGIGPFCGSRDHSTMKAGDEYVSRMRTRE